MQSVPLGTSSRKGQCKVVKGVRYERDVLELAEACAKNPGGITKTNVDELYELAMDGNRITPVERRTLENAMTLSITPEAKSHLQAKLAAYTPIVKPVPKTAKEKTKHRQEKKEDSKAMDKYTS